MAQQDLSQLIKEMDKAGFSGAIFLKTDSKGNPETITPCFKVSSVSELAEILLGIRRSIDSLLEQMTGRSQN